MATNTKGNWKRIAKVFDRPLITPVFVKNMYLEAFPDKQTVLKKRVKYTILEDLMIAKYA